MNRDPKKDELSNSGKWYEIRVKGELPRGWSNWFEGLEVRRSRPGESILSGFMVDQSALHGILAKIRDLNLELISVTRGAPGAASAGHEEKGGNHEDSQRA